jgi:hypothetical protein
MMIHELEENSGGRGLPEKLPAGERVLWQGAPSWRTLFVRAFHGRTVALYFAALVGWQAVNSALHGTAPATIASRTGIFVLLSLLPLALTAAYCWGVQKTTVYTVTNRRVVMSYGIGLAMSVNLPFSKIASAGLRAYPNGAGDIALTMLRDAAVSYVMVWPHVRPWHMGAPEPMLRCIPDAEQAAMTLSRALAAEACLPVGFTAAPKRAPSRLPEAAQAA